MSRSRRKTKIFGHTSSQSEKLYKRYSNRARRRSVRQYLLVSETENVLCPHDAEFGNPWSGPKDGRHYWPEADEKSMRK